ISNKIALILRYAPEAAAPERRQELNRYAGLRYKALRAREHGAKAVLIVTGPNSPNAGELIPLAQDGAVAGSDIVAASVSSAVADQLLAAAGKDLKAIQSDLDRENPHAAGSFEIPGLQVRLATSVIRVRQSDRNVIAHFPPRNSTEYVMIGAHYDHLGFGEQSSRETANESGQVHNGADDNAS